MAIVLYPSKPYDKAKIVLTILCRESSIEAISTQCRVPNHILQKWIEEFVTAGTSALPEDYPPLRKIREEEKDLRMEELPLSVRSLRLLKKAGIETLDQVIRLEKDEFENIFHGQKKSRSEVLEMLKLMGLSIAAESVNS